jgi:sulfide:quinone oxidoreductase
MRIMTLNDTLTVSAQVQPLDLEQLRDKGVTTLVCNRPDGESQDQPSIAELTQAAEKYGIDVIAMPFRSGEQTAEQVTEFAELLSSAQAAGKKIHAYCRTGNRSTCLWAAASVGNGASVEQVLAAAKDCGFDVTETVKPYSGETPMSATNKTVVDSAKPSYDIVIVGAGSGGIAVAASLLKRKRDLRIALIDPAEKHYYQPGWTMVGGGVFSDTQTMRNMRDLIPKGVSWIKQSVVEFAPQENTVQLDNGQSLHYQQLIVAPGLVLDWDGVKGLKESLGKNGVTSNYSYQYAPYTWELVKGLKKGRAIFTQPPMPIKCAGAPQKALYLSGDHWFRSGALKDINIDFYNAGAVLFGVAAYVPALQNYIDKYRAKLHFKHTLVEVDGENKRAYFKSGDPSNEGEVICEEFDMLHVCPPQKAPDFVAKSALADAAGWLDVDQFTLQQKQFANIWGLGDVTNAPNAKTMAAVRKQVPVVADNVMSAMNNRALEAGYDGYGSCPLTVERGKIVLAEFGYGGKLLPSFPTFLLNGSQATRTAWILKKDILPGIYWHAMLKGREWLAAPKALKSLKP